MSVRRFVVGGCVYRNMVHVRHQGSVMELMAASVVDPQCRLVMDSLSYMHTSNLPQGRCQWLRTQLDTEASLAVSIDSDSSFSGTELLHIMGNVRAGIAIGVVPFLVGGTDNTTNIITGGRRVEVHKLPSAPAVIDSGGFGLAVFNLDWFRAHWRTPYPTLPDGDDAIRIGEDIAMCQEVNRRGGAVLALPITATHVDMVGLPGRTLAYRDGPLVI